ncbi:DUF3667 domain-containing protein [Maribacter polysaccharolyticus]|uniref:DUF3667 domain-containing protein n=1 Tax=Maribacter polysaccharolyticus TaxID=3020831 RepID=UPI00237F10B8|nr:DUF3667 domain-containing protein [Maribacter polysaccharolyticus]
MNMANKLISFSKKRDQLKYRGTSCRNCGRQLDLSDKFCPNCSQANSTKKLTLRDFFDEFFANIISYDSKLLKTLSALLWRPGKITKDYVNGKRVSYTNPFRFLLSLAIIYFLAISFNSDFSKLDEIVQDKDTPSFSSFFGDNGTLNLDLGDHEEQKELSNVIDSLKLSEEIQKISNQIKTKDSITLSHPTESFNAFADSTFGARISGKYKVISLLINKQGLKSYGTLLDKYSIEDTNENKIVFNSARSVNKFSKQPGSFLNDLISKLPFATFFFLPLFAIFIWLAYIRKKYTYTDHLIFSFHNQSLLFILLIISFLVDSVFKVDSGWIFISIFSIYLFRAMRIFYGQGTLKTIVKYLFLNTIFFILAGISGILLFTGSLITY